MRERLILLNKAYDLCEVLGIGERDLDDFINNNEDDYNCDLNKIIGILEIAIKIKNELGDGFRGCDLNSRYRNYIYEWDADDIGVRVYVKNKNNCDVDIIVEDDHLEVCDQDYVDETDEMYNLNDYKKACYYAVNMLNVEK